MEQGRGSFAAKRCQCYSETNILEVPARISFHSLPSFIKPQYIQQEHLVYYLWINTVPKRNEDILVSLLNNIFN